ncbi:sensor histidine kinase [Thermosediminibacter litoriperuensis]|uniref:histidine kinase n=1 Tax=Thermosediminibacter litoriperuensis TaxID=291989 RepID=A0A5S5AJW9_9FIRM|nr:ATP-binding protein [Thermosediminibacter litoriperuensis]TYP50896.1 two-component system sensor histidine kinase YcbA [Thermosediminibacter litoriperuensis]
MTVRKYFKEMLITAALTAIIGEVYFYPFGTAFRFTAGVIAISFLMLYFKEIPEIILVPFSGAVVFLFRVFLSAALRQVDFAGAVDLHYPAFFFYLTYGAFLRLGRVKEQLTAPINFVSVMTLSDIAANFVELFIRREMDFNYFQDIFTLVVGVGLLRSIITFSLYWLMERYKLIIVKEEHEKRYAELLELLSELKAELIFLRKSNRDLEDAMKEGYEIYRRLASPLDDQELIRLRKRALNLAREIHEIKKDYIRISAGFSQLLPEEDKEGMRMSAILSLLKANTKRWMIGQGKKVDFTAYVDRDFIVTNYFTFFSILSNLIYNALDAIKKEGGRIEVRVYTCGDRIKMSVLDDGCGIDPRDLPYIFEPGFSTKILEDGSVSTGLGLTHVKNLVEDMGGRILVTSSPGRGSRFDVEIPVDEKFIKLENREG